MSKCPVYKSDQLTKETARKVGHQVLKLKDVKNIGITNGLKKDDLKKVRKD